MIVSLDAASATVRKLATTPGERQRLHHEATILDVARHPGVVRLVGEGPDTLEVAAVTGWCLADLGQLTPAEVAGLGSAVATIVADLHHLGVVHGGIDAGHVLIGSDGRPILCSLGRGRAQSLDPQSTRLDSAALVAMLSACLPPGPAGDPMRRALGPTRVLRLASRHPPTAGVLASRLAAIPGARLPDPPGARPADAHPPLDRRQSRRPSALAVGALLVAGALAVAIPATFRSGRRPSTDFAAKVGCPAVDLGCVPVERRHGVVLTSGGSFAIGRTGEPLVVGRWNCGPALPALLRPDRGEVWVWDGWPGVGTPVAARLAGRVEGAQTLRVLAGPSGCDGLAVIARGGSVTTFRPLQI